MFVNNIELATAVEGGKFAGDEVNAVQFGKKKKEEEEEELGSWKIDSVKF